MEQMRVGVWFYGLATVATGILDIVWGGFEGSHQPIKAFGQHIPGQQVLAYIAGVWLVAAGLAILWRRTARIGAVGSAVIYLIFGLFWLPRFYVVPHTLGFHISILIFIVFGLAQQLLLAAPGVMVYAETTSDPVWRERQLVAARWMLGLSPIVFGLGHLINVHAMYASSRIGFRLEVSGQCLPASLSYLQGVLLSREFATFWPPGSLC
jgi:uncharacterized membrane protein YphA (DoxX/SURF4 family)